MKHKVQNKDTKTLVLSNDEVTFLMNLCDKELERILHLTNSTDLETHNQLTENDYIDKAMLYRLCQIFNI